MDRKVDNVVKITTTLDNGFFKYWLEFLKPFHQLTNREIMVVASFLKHRYELSKVITDSAILDKVVMGSDTKKKIAEELGFATQHFHVIMNRLRNRNIIIGDKLNPRFIPNIKEGAKDFQLLLLFDLNEVQPNNSENSKKV